MFSIIIPVYNKAKYIAFSVQSVINQTFVDFELIIVDDGSTDDSLEIIDKNFEDSRIKVIRQNNSGVSAARNRGIASAQYQYVAFLDADDFWDPTFLETFYDVISLYGNTPPAIIGCCYEIVYEHKLLERPKAGQSPFVIKEYFKKAHQNALFSSSSTIVHRSVFERLEGFNPNILHGEDIDMWFRIMMSEPMAIFIPVRLSFYFMGDPTQAMANLPNLEKI
jgi:glycosyltransferase involved in cell wall biosynthesis